MAILKIARMGHPVLLRRADPVEDPTAPGIAQLVADMFETLEDAGGIGLAAPQIHVSLALFIHAIPAARARAVNDGPPPARTETDADAPPCERGVLINPAITPIGTAMVSRVEGCLSIPGWRGEVLRHARVAYEGVDLRGERVSGEAEGLLAVVMQHEYDHLEGILYPMRMNDLGRLGFTEEMARFAPSLASIRSDADPEHDR